MNSLTQSWLYLIYSEAKKYGLCDVADLSFGAMVDIYKYDFTARIETADPNGYRPDESEYDIVAIFTSGGERMCVPVPKLSSTAVATFYKRGTVVKHSAHDHPSFSTTEEQRTEMMGELLKKLIEGYGDREFRAHQIFVDAPELLSTYEHAKRALLRAQALAPAMTEAPNG